MKNDPFLFRRESATELYLIRHGDAIPGPDEIIPSGVYDDLPLSREGREQARKLAERLKNTRFDAAYSSPLRRCRETGEPLLRHLDLQPSIIDELKEIHIGDVVDILKVQEGDNRNALSQALQRRQVETVRIAASSGNWDTIGSDESSKGFRKRVVDAVDSIVERHRGQRVIVFCHGGVINAYAAEVLGLDKEFFFPTVNTSITIIRATTERRVLYVLNDVAHLRMDQG
ncbi:MAG: histidine phosphatase family protein [Ktedonobacteraceae bacterium]|nr:histidine phosphatase family protein [Ktedonobacteraceae bacterium]